MIVHVVDGTYELFRHFYGLRRFNKGKDRPYGAVSGVLQTVLQMIDHVKGSASRGPSATYLGVVISEERLHPAARFPSPPSCRRCRLRRSPLSGNIGL